VEDGGLGDDAVVVLRGTVQDEHGGTVLGGGRHDRQVRALAGGLLDREAHHDRRRALGQAVQLEVEGRDLVGSCHDRDAVPGLGPEAAAGGHPGAQPVPVRQDQRSAEHDEPREERVPDDELEDGHGRRGREGRAHGCADRLRTSPRDLREAEAVGRRAEEPGIHEGPGEAAGARQVVVPDPRGVRLGGAEDDRDDAQVQEGTRAATHGSSISAHPPGDQGPYDPFRTTRCD
jgi:hypothetical protein